MFEGLPDLGKIMGIMEKYKDIDINNVKIVIEKYDNALIIKLVSDSNKMGDIFTDMLPMIFSQIPKENIKIIDKTG